MEHSEMASPDKSEQLVKPKTESMNDKDNEMMTEETFQTNQCADVESNKRKFDELEQSLKPKKEDATDPDYEIKSEGSSEEECVPNNKKRKKRPCPICDKCLVSPSVHLKQVHSLSDADTLAILQEIKLSRGSPSKYAKAPQKCPILDCPLYVQRLNKHMKHCLSKRCQVTDKSTQQTLIAIVLSGSEVPKDMVDQVKTVLDPSFYAEGEAEVDTEGKVTVEELNFIEGISAEDETQSATVASSTTQSGRWLEDYSVKYGVDSLPDSELKLLDDFDKHMCTLEGGEHNDPWKRGYTRNVLKVFIGSAGSTHALVIETQILSCQEPSGLVAQMRADEVPPGTMLSWLGFLRRYLSFLESTKDENVDRAKKMIGRWISRLNIHRKTRVQLLKLDSELQVAACIRSIKRFHAGPKYRQTVDLLRQRPKQLDVPCLMDVRDVLLTLMIILNRCRAGSICNLKDVEVESARNHEGHFVIRTSCKTMATYGLQNLVMTEEQYRQLQLYIDLKNMVFDSDYTFVNRAGNQIQDLSRILSETLGTRATATLLRKAGVVQLLQAGGDMAAAAEHMRHSAATQSTYYATYQGVGRSLQTCGFFKRAMVGGSSESADQEGKSEALAMDGGESSGTACQEVKKAEATEMEPLDGVESSGSAHEEGNPEALATVSTSGGPDEQVLEAVEVNPETATDSKPEESETQESDPAVMVMAKSAVTAVLDNDHQAGRIWRKVPIEQFQLLKEYVPKNTKTRELRSLLLSDPRLAPLLDLFTVKQIRDKCRSWWE